MAWVLDGLMLWLFAALDDDETWVGKGVASSTNKKGNSERLARCS
jgi:hypothetical protein